jgi:DNA modification methylase
VVWVVGDATINGSETGTSFRQALYFKEVGFNLHDTMIYQKASGACGSNYAYWQVFEYMFILSRDIPKTRNLLRDRVNVKPPQVVKWVAGHRNKDNSKKARRTQILREFGVRFNVWNLDAANGVDRETEHPAQFPEALARDHILSWSNEGDLVYDPFMGSGTTAKAAHQLGRRWIGSEISAEYVELANKRLEPYLAQESLFQ